MEKYVGVVFLAFLIGCGSEARAPEPDAYDLGERSLDSGVPDVSDAGGRDTDAGFDSPDAASQSGVVGTRVNGNPDCSYLGLDGVKIDPADTGKYDTEFGAVGIVNEGTSVRWLAAFSIEAAIVKGGPAAMVWEYDYPAVTSREATAPEDLREGGYHDVGHVLFCR